MTPLNRLFSYIGPPLTTTAKNVLYFSVSAHDTLLNPPSKTPADYLERAGIRVLSATLPCHDIGLWPTTVQETWSVHKEELKTFLRDTLTSLEEIKENIGPIHAVMGLSRGAFIGAHIVSRSDIPILLGFSPLCKLIDVPDLDLIHSAHDLAKKRIRFYIGHHDERVGTENVIGVIKKSMEEAKKQKIKMADIDLVMKPSSGFQGHGTLEPVFAEGVSWLINHL